MTFVWIVLIGFVAVCIVDCVVIHKVLQKKTVAGHYMAVTMVSSLVVTVGYLISLFVRQELLYSIFSSIYFAGIDVTVFALLLFIASLTQGSNRRVKLHGLWWVGLGYLIFDVIVMLLNPVLHLAIHYIPRDTIISHYSYDMQLLFTMHLTFAYVMVGCSLVLLLRKTFSVPKAYRWSYIRAITIIIAVVAFNALYLYIPGPEGYDFVDYSLAGYSAAGVFLYFLCFENYSGHRFAALHTWIYENVNQGIVLFDYDNCISIHNQMATRLLPDGVLEPGMRLETFAERCGISREMLESTERKSFQCYFTDGQVSRSVRCDSNVMLSEKGKIMSRLLVFSDLSTDTDILTGFVNWNYYKYHHANLAHDEPYIVAACDINGLSAINSMKGREIGDQAIQAVAQALRDSFP